VRCLIHLDARVVNPTGDGADPRGRVRSAVMGFAVGNVSDHGY
jgi:hypothetical protein